MSASSSDRRGLPFVPKQLDEYGLTPAQFRVFCRISRRGVCTESIGNMARGCRLNAKTVKAALPVLLSCRLVSKQKRLGETSVYTVAPLAEWLPSPWASQARRATQAPKRPAPPAKTSPSHPAQAEPCKGSPAEGSPEKGGSRELTTAEKLFSQTELERVERRMKVIRGNYDGHETWSEADRDEMRTLKQRRKALMEQVGFTV